MIAPGLDTDPRSHANVALAPVPVSEPGAVPGASTNISTTYLRFFFRCRQVVVDLRQIQ
jgi:hypothetical protein